MDAKFEAHDTRKVTVLLKQAATGELQPQMWSLETI